jgi:hypothetical protein
MIPATQDYIAVTLSSGSQVCFEALSLGGSEEVGGRIPTIGELLASVKEFAAQVGAAVEASGASAASVEFGVTVGMEAGRLVAVIAKGTASVNLKVTMTFTK